AAAAAIGIYFLHVPSTSQLFILSLHDALPIYFLLELRELDAVGGRILSEYVVVRDGATRRYPIFVRLLWPPELRDWLLAAARGRSEEHTSELQSRGHVVCRLLLEKKHDDGHRG